MSIRGAENNGSAGAERRAGGGQRIHFEALVAVGEPRGGGFEAESVDVSPEGMRLRTAYLPEVGDKLTCRFDGASGEVVAEGEVAWRNQEARGGEFGVHFVGLDAATAEAIRAMCAPEGSEEPAAPAEAPTMPRGARVRLHIEGLGSPMKARVREAATKDLEVGSNLEFLKVGRSLELEDVEQGKKREAWIDGVKVDVDPATSIPQLVVTLRYEATAAAAAADKPAKRAGARESAEPPTRRTAPPPAPEDRKSVADAHASADDSDDGGEDHDGEKEGMGARAARASLAVAGKIGPTLSGMGSRAKGAMTGIVAAIQKKREARVEADKASAPRRTTAPAPGGGLKSEGRHLVRDDGAEEQEEAAAPPPRMNRRAAAIGGALGLTAVLVIFGVSRSLGAHGAASATATSADATAASASAAPIAAAELPAGAASGTPVANVPLFGATPLSTTEPVPPPAAPSASAAALAGAAPDGDGAGPGDGDDDGPTDGKGASNLKEWGQGSVSHPIVLKIKMDGPVERLNGASGAMGFTISLPDRRALSTASDLARKDKRLASVNVVNTSHGAEVTVQFKDGVPPYKARAKGDRLEIALGTEHGASKKVAKKKGDKPKAGSKKKPAH